MAVTHEPSKIERSALVCRVCGNGTDNGVLTAREMMFGLRDFFDYLVCSRCGCFQLRSAPGDWSRYYPPDYYSYVERSEGLLKRLLKRLRARQTLGHPSLPGALLVVLWGIPPFARWAGPAGLAWDDAILDVGSGAGELLLEMSNAGFSNLTGIDPYIPQDIVLREGARVLKRHIHEVHGRFDFVLMNHSFEHMDDPEAALKDAARLLPAGKKLLIRTPVAGKEAWRTYGADWVQLDAPRHVFLHTEESIRLLSDRAGFVLEAVTYDSDAFQFWGSEQYRRDIPLRDARSYAVSPRRSPFTPKAIAEYGRQAAELNTRGQGDQACFWLKRC